jgi:hypothetical protein
MVVLRTQFFYPSWWYWEFSSSNYYPVWRYLRFILLGCDLVSVVNQIVMILEEFLEEVSVLEGKDTTLPWNVKIQLPTFTVISQKNRILSCVPAKTSKLIILIVVYWLGSICTVLKLERFQFKVILWHLMSCVLIMHCGAQNTKCWA